MDLFEDIELTIASIQRGDDSDIVQKAWIEALLGDTTQSPSPLACAPPSSPPPSPLVSSNDPWMEFHRLSPPGQSFDFSLPADLFDPQPAPLTTVDLQSILEPAAGDSLLYKKSQPSPPPLDSLWADLCLQPSAVADQLDPHPPPSPSPSPPLPPPTVDDSPINQPQKSPLFPTPPDAPAVPPDNFKDSPSESLPPPLPSPTTTVDDAGLEPKSYDSPPPPPPHTGYVQPAPPLHHTAPVGTFYLQPQDPPLPTPIAQANPSMVYYQPHVPPPPPPPPPPAAAAAMTQADLTEVLYLQPPTTTVLSDPYNGLQPSVMSQGCYLQPRPCSCGAAGQTNQWLLHPQFVNRPTALLPGNAIPVRISNGKLVYSNPPMIPGDINPTSRKRKQTRVKDDDGKPYIKKPPNAFLIFMKEQRPNVIAELQSRNNAVVNAMLGKRWAALPQEQKHVYFLEADKLRVLHEQQYPDWSSRDNYGKKRKRERRSSFVQSQFTGQDVCST